MNRNTNVKNLVIIALFSAIIIVQTFIPFLGYVKLFGLVDFTIVHVSVLIAACLLGWKLGALIGGVWGVTSMIYAYTSAGILNPLFYNPLISVVPRIAVGLVAGFLYSLLSKKLHQSTSALVAAVAGTLVNTTLVLAGFYFFGYQLILSTLGGTTGGPSDPVLTFVFSLIGTNTIAEVIAAAVLVPAIVLPLQKLAKR